MRRPASIKCRLNIRSLEKDRGVGQHLNQPEVRICKCESNFVRCNFIFFRSSAECDRHIDSTAGGDPRRTGHGRLAVREEAAGRQRHTGQHRRKQSSDRRLKTGVLYVVAVQPPQCHRHTPTLIIYVPKKRLFFPTKLSKLSLIMKHCEDGV